MPLPELKPNSTTDKEKNHAAYFDALYLADPERLGLRSACLEPLGVNLLLQRWVHHNSRVVVQTHMYNEVTAGPYEEADLAEDWCETRLADGLDVRDATRECLDWLRQPQTAGGPARQDLLVDPQLRAAVRAAARQHLRSLSRPSPPA